ncbi:unnamed protein product [Calypogeia fissa]
MDAEGFDAMDGVEDGMNGEGESKGRGSSSDEKGSDSDDPRLPLESTANVKKRKSPSGVEKGGSTSGKVDKGPENESNNAAPRKSKKMVREEVEDLRAETQRLLRETPGTSFAAEQAVRKPVSSLIEKIRQRKLQLSSSLAKGSTSTLGISLKVSTLEQKDVLDEDTLDDEIEFVMCKPPIRVVVKQEPGEPSTSGVPRAESDDNPVPVDAMDDGGDRPSSQPGTPDLRLDRSNSCSGCKSPPKSFLRAPLLESQDLYSDSQLSLKEDSPVLGDDEDVIPVVGSRLNLHLDTETQYDDRWLEDDFGKENRDPTSISLPEHIPVVADVRGLVDDEAEDEDEDNSSLDDEDDEGQETGRDLKDLLTQDAGEKAADVERRAELHSKWLEQQDLAMEDNILQRIETGWKTKGKKEMPALLSDSQDRTSLGDNVSRPFKGIERLGEPASSDLEALRKQVKDDDCILERGSGPGNLDQDGANPMQQEDYQESSDDEEAEENLRRQLFLQESEEKIEFLSVADDESSREILGLINKVNVAAIKPRTTTGHKEARASATGYHQPLQHQSSFLRRKVTTVSATTRQGSGNSRSYVFGRDDSNSRDASRLDNKEQVGKANTSDEPKANSATQSTQKGAFSRPKSALPNDAKPRGPSLFQVLRQQAAELASGKNPLDLSGSSSRGDNLSIFLPVKPSPKPKGSRGR